MKQGIDPGRHDRVAEGQEVVRVLPKTLRLSHRLVVDDDGA
ncbi:hypothetical protein [Moorella sp. ACPs]